MCSHIFKTLNKVQSHLIVWGNPFSVNEANNVIICISGNPGITDFYTEFGSEIYKNTKLPVCIVGHAGHEEVPDEHSNKLKGQEHLFDLEGQVNHKLDLINNFIPKNVKLHLIGHSIGAWMILELLHKNEALIHRISSVNLLFPTVQRMAKSKNGLFLNNVIRNIHKLVMMLFYLMNLIPDSIRNMLIGTYMKFQSLPPQYSGRILKFCHPSVGEKVLFLAYNEMDTVKVLNCEILDTIKEKTNVLYSSRDGWAPVHYMDDFKMFEPHLKLKEVDADHAFVLKSSSEIASIVSDFILSKIIN